MPIFSGNNLGDVIFEDKIRYFPQEIGGWGKKNMRKFIWRERKEDFFTVFVSEFLLRKTRAESVDKFMREFVNRYTSFKSLSELEIETLATELKPLGLHNQRAKALIDISNKMIELGIPSYEDIINLPQCGRYIASAVECFYRRKRVAIIDANVQRILRRFFSDHLERNLVGNDDLWEFSLKLIPNVNYVDYNYSLLDFGALICKPRKPNCSECIIRARCDYANKVNW